RGWGRRLCGNHPYWRPRRKCDGITRQAIGSNQRSRRAWPAHAYGECCDALVEHGGLLPVLATVRGAWHSRKAAGSQPGPPALLRRVACPLLTHPCASDASTAIAD